MATGIFGIFAAAAMTTWTTLQLSALNTSAYARRQSDQMRVLDYLKRDIRRASLVQVYNGATLVTGTATGSELRVTLPDYYTDTREDDNAKGGSASNPPTLTAGAITYGTSFVVSYYAQNGGIVRKEGATERVIADEVGGFALTFNTEASGQIRSRVTYNQRLVSWRNKFLARQVEILVPQRKSILP